jgi:integrase/recombinase XerD
MLTTYRRHLRRCRHRGHGRRYRHCQCPIYVDGFLAGKEIRESLKTKNWQLAQDKVREWEAEDRKTVEQQPKTLEAAWKEFIADLKARQLHESTLRKYKLLERQMEEIARDRGLRYLQEFDLPQLSQFRTSWKDGPRSSGKKLERLRALFRFAQQMGWVQKNPAADLKPPRVALCPTLPYDCEELIRILAAIDRYREQFPIRGTENALRLRGLVLLLRYSGMRISDAVSLATDRIQGERLFLYTQKTGVAVNTVLPEFVVQALRDVPNVTEQYFFWDGTSKLEIAVGSWRRRLARLFELAEVPKAYPHRFRDTFAVELLLSGVPIERVSILLGHHSGICSAFGSRIPCSIFSQDTPLR